MKGSVLFVGAGKVGRALYEMLRMQGVEAWLRSARTLRAQGLPRADLVVIASRDDRIEDVARIIASSAELPRAVVHCAGALDVAPLAPLAGRGVAVGTMHPCLSFASPRTGIALPGGALLITGDRVAVRLAQDLARTIAMNAVCPKQLDRSLYHAACALTANGSAALAEASSRLLDAAGISADDARRLLGPLLRSVAHNVGHLAPADALTGPVVRGDRATVRRHRAAVHRAVPDLSKLFTAMLAAQEALVARKQARLSKGRPAPKSPPRRSKNPLIEPLRDPKKMRKKGFKAP